MEKEGWQRRGKVAGVLQAGRRVCRCAVNTAV